MPISRRFLVAPSLARLFRQKCGSQQVIEGHFPPQDERHSHVTIGPGGSQLVLTSFAASPETSEDRTELPVAHAEALLQVCPGTLVFERSLVRLHDQDARLDRFVIPGQLHLASVEFTTAIDAATFLPPVWFGEEVSDDNSYKNWVMALSGMPNAPDTEASNAALEAMLDLLDLHQPPEAAKRSGRNYEGASPSVDGARIRSPVSAASMPKALGLPGWDGRPILQAALKENTHAVDQLASVVEGLSAALSPAALAGNGADADSSSRRGWRRVSR